MVVYADVIEEDLGQHRQLRVLYCQSIDNSAMNALLSYREDGTSPFVMLSKYGLKEE
ncbi:hypothetical protein BJX70DRAFT_367026 [Aspergillus crustosus]